MAENLLNLREKHIMGVDTREQILSRDACASLSDYDLTVIGITQADASYEFARLQPVMGQILISTGGAGAVLVGGEWRDCPPGSAYITPPDAPHAYHTRAGTQWQFVWANYSGRQGLPGRLDRPLLAAIDPAPVQAIFHGLVYEARHQALRDAVDLWCQILHLHLSRTLTDPPPDTRLTRTWETVQQDLRHPWTLAHMARLACTSKQHFHRLCRETYGESPMRHLARLRMRSAQDLLRYTSEPIGAVAHQVGYNDAFAFSAAFKRHVGLAPSAYRRER